MNASPHFESTRLWALLGVLLLSAPMAMQVSAQDMPSQRQLRAYIPPDQLVSFLPSTPFDTFLELINPISVRVTGKQVIDPEGQDFPIGIAVTSMHFLDALEMVLNYNGFVYRETDKYFMVEAPPTGPQQVGALTAVGAPTGGGGSIIPGGTSSAAPAVLPASLSTRQLRISAVLFELNHTKAKETGIDWSVIFGSESGGGGQQAAGGANAASNKISFSLKTEEMFSSLNDIIDAPTNINFSDLNSLIRFAENSGVGETVASPDVNVQSGVQGRIQVGSDVPVQVRDFAGNTVTQFFSTGIIIQVTPTLIEQATADTVGAPVVEFIHLDVDVEKSGSRPSAAGVIIDRSSANTQVVMLDGEQIVIGGLYNTEETVSRRGIPILKDLPGWVFGLRYIFGRTARATTQKELLIVLQAEVVQPLLERMALPFREDVLNARRAEVDEAIRRVNERLAKTVQRGRQTAGTDVQQKN